MPEQEKEAADVPEQEQQPAELEADPNEAKLEEDGSCGEETDTDGELPTEEDIENADDLCLLQSHLK